jgi:hypothetical protein
MTRILHAGAVGGSLFLLAACGGGSSGDGERYSLDSTQDALRELSLAGLVLNDVPDGQPEGDATAATAKRLGGGSGWGAATLPARLGTIAKAETACPQGGDRDVTSGTKERDFLSFNVQDLDVSFDREIDDQCLYPVAVPAPLTATKLYSGQFEEGNSGTLENGSRYAYVADGTSNQAYVTTYREYDSSNRLIYSEVQGSLGTVESLQAGDGALDVRADYDYSVDSSEWFSGRREDYFAVVKLGQNLLAPYRAFRDGQELSFSGVYSYRTSDCPGSDVTVTTEEVIELQRVGDADYPVGGRLRFAADGKTAVFAFNAGGGATLTINGRTETLTQSQVRAAINDEPC